MDCFLTAWENHKKKVVPIEAEITITKNLSFLPSQSIKLIFYTGYSFLQQYPFLNASLFIILTINSPLSDFLNHLLTPDSIFISLSQIWPLE